MVKLRFKILFELSVFRFEDQTRVFQERRGVMKSGCYLTIILNSISQSYVHYVAMIRMGREPGCNQPLCIGDDTVQEVFDGIDQYVEHVSSLGPILKEVVVTDYVEFAGFVYYDNKCWPAYWQKHLFNLMVSPNLGETLLSYQYLYVHEPVMYEFLLRIARELGPTFVLPKIEALDIMNHSN
nr:MAG: RNA-dependent RNA polymerase [Solemoviridae sp.]